MDEILEEVDMAEDGKGSGRGRGKILSIVLDGRKKLENDENGEEEGRGCVNDKGLELHFRQHSRSLTCTREFLLCTDYVIMSVSATLYSIAIHVMYCIESFSMFLMKVGIFSQKQGMNIWNETLNIHRHPGLSVYESSQEAV